MLLQLMKRFDIAGKRRESILMLNWVGAGLAGLVFLEASCIFASRGVPVLDAMGQWLYNVDAG